MEETQEIAQRKILILRLVRLLCLVASLKYKRELMLYLIDLLRYRRTIVFKSETERALKAPVFDSLREFIKNQRLNGRLYDEHVKTGYEDIPEPSPSDRLDLAIAMEKSLLCYERPHEMKEEKIDPAIKSRRIVYEREVEHYDSDVKKEMAEINADTKRLKHACDLLYINYTLFRKVGSKRYRITRDVESLFNFILNNCFKQCEKRKRVIQSPSQEFLIDLRVKYRDALYSLEYDEKTVSRQLRRFERGTGCPPKIEYIPHSPVTVEAIREMENEVTLSADEWDMFADQIEYYYKTELRPKLMDFCRGEALKSFLTTIGKADLYPYDKNPFDDWIAARMGTTQPET